VLDELLPGSQITSASLHGEGMFLLTRERRELSRRREVSGQFLELPAAMVRRRRRHERNPSPSAPPCRLPPYPGVRAATEARFRRWCPAANTLREVLEFGEHELEITYSGPEGLMKARDFKPEIVFCDIGLPEMDGYHVAQAFRADGALRSTYLVALTGYALPADVARAKEAGFDQHMAKPFSVEKLEQILATAPAAGEGR
jgi:CheY-like chemotaxis protein